MKNLSIKLITLVMAIAISLSCGVTSFAETPATLEDYKTVNADQKDYYNNTYRPVYAEYLQAIRDFRTEIRNTEFATKEQAQRVIDDLTALVKSHKDFYGTRTTEGKSRYEVPKVRVAMYKAADDDKDYDTAITLCKELKTLVIARVEHMNSVINKIKNYTMIEEEHISNYISALEIAYNSFDMVTRFPIHSQAQNITTSIAYKVAAKVVELGFDPVEYSWVIYGVPGGTKVDYIVFSTDELGQVGSTINSIMYKNGTLTEGTSKVSTATYTYEDFFKKYNVIDGFTAK